MDEHDRSRLSNKGGGGSREPLPPETQVMIGAPMSEHAMTSDKVRENHARRMAQRQGLVLVKSRRRDPLALDYGGYTLVDAATDAVVAGDGPIPYFLDLDEAEAWLTDPPLQWLDCVRRRSQKHPPKEWALTTFRLHLIGTSPLIGPHANGCRGMDWMPPMFGRKSKRREEGM